VPQLEIPSAKEHEHAKHSEEQHEEDEDEDEDEEEDDGRSVDPRMLSRTMAKRFAAAEAFVSSNDDFLDTVDPESEIMLLALKHQVTDGPNHTEKPGFFALTETKELW
jgi:hypothetical protein